MNKWEVIHVGAITVGIKKDKLTKIHAKRLIEQLKFSGIHYDFEIKEIITEDHNLRNKSFDTQDAGGLFVKELDELLLNESVDIVIHRLKNSVRLAVDERVNEYIPKRDDHRDVYIARDHIPLADLPKDARIGTNSVRRLAQLSLIHDHLTTTKLKGSIGSKVQQLHNGEYEALILSAESVKRFGLSEAIITEYLPVDQVTPAAGQGALSVKGLAENKLIDNFISKINDPDTNKAIQTERLFLQKIQLSEDFST